MRKKYAPKQAALAERLRRAEQAVERETAAGVRSEDADRGVGWRDDLLGALFGRKAVTGTIGRATTAARGVGRSMKEASDIKRASESVESVKAAIAALDGEIAEDVAALSARIEHDAPLEQVSIAPKRGQIEVQFVALAWMPEGSVSRRHDRRPRPPRRPAAVVVAALFALGLPAGFRWPELAAGPPRDRHQRPRAAPGSRRARAAAAPGSIRFAIIGDSGRGDRWQQEVADQMVAWRARFPFTFVLMLGDNIYGSSTPHDYELKFERPTGRCSTRGWCSTRRSAITTIPARSTTQLFNMEGPAVLHLPRERAPPSGASRRRRAVLRAGQPVVRSAGSSTGCASS